MTFLNMVMHASRELIIHSIYRDDEGYIRSLGNTILEFSKVVPDGLLVFFPSYKFMNDCILFWKRYSEGIWSTINKQKRIFVESKAKDEFLATMKEYYATINNRDSNGAIFMAIMRGKVSEGKYAMVFME